MKFGCVIQNEGRRGWVTCGSFFWWGKEQREKSCAQEASCKNKTQEGGGVIMTGEGKREIDRGIRYTKPRKIVGKNRHVINGCWKSGENERRTSEWLRKTSKSVYVHSTHARRRRRRVL